jgi:hypothetical protein
VQGSKLDPGPNPPDLSGDLVSFVTPVVFDTPKWNHKFGDCILQPVDVAEPGVTVRAKFVSLKKTYISGDSDHNTVIPRYTSFRLYEMHKLIPVFQFTSQFSLIRAPSSRKPIVVSGAPSRKVIEN